VFLLSILFKYLAVIDQKDSEDSDEGGSIRIDEESPYFKSEKQLEDESSRVPLLSGENEEGLPHYSMYDYNDDCDDCSDSEDDDDDEEGGDRERLLRGHRHVRDYHSLPEYIEDNCEPQVYVA